MMRIWLVVLFVLLFAPPGLPLVFGEEPALPLGLGEDQKTQEEEPALPAGLGEDDSAASGASTAPMKETSLPFNYRGFLESRGGVRVFDDPNEKSASIGEVRLQTQVDKDFDWVSARITSDFLADTVANDWPVELETGDGFIDLREAFLFFRMGEYADLKVGRQILTWGTGDFLFINDLFPKDYNAFFIGRDDEYLKAPSDALKLSLFSEVVNLDFVYTPSFDADRFIDGRRISFFNPLAGDITGRDQPLQVDRPQGWFRDDEISARLYRRFGSVEAALYGYRGYWKSPGGFDIQSGEATFPRLAVYGGSLRGPLLSGIANLEVGYYDSRDDRSGDNPLVRNSEFRALAGYERELMSNFTIGMQYYVEQLLDYGDFRRALPQEAYRQDEYRQLLTVRLTRLLLNQNLQLSFFSFFSPTDEDAYPRAKASYKLNDSVQLEVGTNFFFGKDERTFFAMFEDNSNVYASIRYGFVGGGG